MTPSFHVAASRRQRGPGFSLIELLVVIAIIALLMGLATPAFFHTMRANRLSAAGQNLVGRISQAQQTAAALNLPVEVRFYQLKDAANVNPDRSFIAYQFLIVKNTSTGEALEPLSAPFFIESGVAISADKINNEDASPLLVTGSGAVFTDDGQGPGTGPDGKLPRQINKTGDATYAAIRFLPDGTVKKLTSTSNGSYVVLERISLQDAYVTLVSEKDLKDSTKVTNYYAVQIDPYTGHARSYQPGLPP